MSLARACRIASTRVGLPADNAPSEHTSENRENNQPEKDSCRVGPVTVCDQRGPQLALGWRVPPSQGCSAGPLAVLWPQPVLGWRVPPPQGCSAGPLSVWDQGLGVTPVSW